MPIDMGRLLFSNFREYLSLLFLLRKNDFEGLTRRQGGECHEKLSVGYAGAANHERKLATQFQGNIEWCQMS